MGTGLVPGLELTSLEMVIQYHTYVILLKQIQNRGQTELVGCILLELQPNTTGSTMSVCRLRTTMDLLAFTGYRKIESTHNGKTLYCVALFCYKDILYYKTRST